MFVKWEQLKRILVLEESFGQSCGTVENYTIPDHMVIRFVHSQLDNFVYSASHIQLVPEEGDDGEDIICNIYAEGESECPFAMVVGSEDAVDLHVFTSNTPNELFWP